MNTRLLFFVLIFAACFASCKNNDNVFAPVVSTYINVVNASSDTVNYYLNGTRQNNASSLFPGGATLYITEPAGSQNYQFKKKGAFNVLFSYPVKLTDSVYNSLFITGETADDAFNTLDVFPATDTLTADSAIALLRFIHAAPDAGTLNVYIGSTQYFASTVFKSASQFIKVPSGIQEIKVFTAGSSTAAIDTTLTFNARNGYSLFARGLLNGAGSKKLSIGFFNSFQ